MRKPNTNRPLPTGLTALAAAALLGLGLAGCAQTEDEYGATTDEEAAEDYAAEDYGTAGEERYGEEIATTPGETGTLPGETAMVAELEIAEVRENPDAWFDRSVTAEVEVADRDLTDRGFWVEKDGEELLVVLVDEPETMPVDIERGQRLRLNEATLKDPATAGQLPGAMLDEETLRLLDEQEVFLLVEQNSIEVIEDEAVRRGG